ncbi:MAG: ribonuclease PH [Ardenticatenaceae bacterium]|nr:ribonuclease PH [Ardenticatenaceae bacterium]MCB9005173.1 ribonuclease PH [Ardenticatenaceae bacterium]
MTRLNGRSPHHLRPITFQLGYTQWAEGSVLAQFGNTHVLCNATLDNTLPNWLRYSSKKHGWLTAEYAMLPRSTHRRTQREQRWPKGRTQEISRLIGRSLRMAVDLDALGERQVIIDCDVLQADGGTRTAAICGGWIATQLALRPLIAAGDLPESVLTHQIAAISVGIVNGEPLLDLAYEEDVNAEVDFNVVMTGTGDLIEVQGTAEKAPFPRAQLNTLLDLAASGITQLAEAQLAALK